MVSEWLESGQDPELTLQVKTVSSFTRVPSTERVDVCVPSEWLPCTGMSLSPETGPVLVRQVTVAVSVNPVITQDMVVSEPFFTSLFTDATSEESFDK